MLGRNKTDSSKLQAGNGAGSMMSGHNSLVQGTNIVGDISSETDLRIDGTLQGKINCKAKIIIGATGKVEGEIKCHTCIIEGSFNGTLQTEELLNLRENASVKGTVTTQKLIVQSGAKFDAICHMGNAAKNPLKKEVSSSDKAA